MLGFANNLLRRFSQIHPHFSVDVRPCSVRNLPTGRQAHFSQLIMQKHYIYIARCNDDTLYTGYTDELKKREKAHNDGKGARYTRGRGPVKIIYFEEFETKSAAMQREYQIKHLKKKEKERLIG